MRTKAKIYLMIIIFTVACKKPYLPPAISAANSYLVVEGVISTTSDSTLIRISRTVNLSSATTTNPEVNASLTVEGDNNTNYSLPEIGNGIYGRPGMPLSGAQKYRLRIQTSNGRIYLSALEVPLNTPPIDSIGFAQQNTAQNTGLQIYVNTHDPAHVVKYYRWNYGETWQFHAKYQSDFITNGSKIVPRTPDQLIYTCFGSDSSSTIVLGTSAGLTSDVIYQNPITQITSTSEKIEAKYSIEVNQYALSADAYNFWVNLKKNTEQLGSIFDAQPSNINGNIQCVSDATEPVIGYISVANIQRKRIFILNEQLPQAWQPAYPYDCEADTNWFANPYTAPPPRNDVAQNLIPLGSPAIPTIGFYKNGSQAPVGYLSSSIDCVDCTIRGSKITPAFWK